MLISFMELIYFIILTLVVGYIFMDIFKPRFQRARFSWKSLKFSALVAAPGIILHELAHKFVAMGFGLAASFKIWPFGLFLGVFLKAISSPFILIAPGYVEIGSTTIPQLTLIAFAGPLINLILWIGSWAVLNYKKRLGRKTAIALYLTKLINMWLFIFNMLPIPPLDGSKVFYGLFKMIF
jgi:Zn-dependent protease